MSVKAKAAWMASEGVDAGELSELAAAEMASSTIRSSQVLGTVRLAIAITAAWRQGLRQLRKQRLGDGHFCRSDR